MAYTAPRTWTTGETVTAAMLNEQVRDNEIYLKTQMDIADRKQLVDCVTADGSAVASTASETTVWTYSVPANTLGTTAAILCRFYGTIQLTGSDSVTFRLKYGGTTIGTASVTTEYASARGVELFGICRANAATNAQRGALFSDGLAPALGTATVDSTSAQNLILTVQFGGASATKTFTLYMATAEILTAV